ncbi:hypothetical protein Afil01_28690 [Actinorhabdospora filicis]|uniref:Uncharacterized protein n=1 Tax=Actinorhabdospora filicis TaxID=1785913 RepID=A0A9W6SLM9_9ACTN|nr:hypothetical protein Afil01_28690 [Actinorhabdospora filicis]
MTASCRPREAGHRTATTISPERRRGTGVSCGQTSLSTARLAVNTGCSRGSNGKSGYGKDDDSRGRPDDKGGKHDK